MYHLFEFVLSINRNWWKDYTKPENYNKRADQLLKYFQSLLQHEAVTKNWIFQNGIYLPKHLREILMNAVRGYYWPPLPDLPHPRYPTLSESRSATPSVSEAWSSITLTDELNQLLQDTEKQLI